MNIIALDYKDPRHAADLITLLNSYARDPMGGQTPLSHNAQKNLAKALDQIDSAFSFICYVEEKPAGLVNCFRGFSTFKCRPLINIHDLVVAHEFRGQGIGQALLAAVEKRARDEGCCKVTLEVLEGNAAAQKLYKKSGFGGYALDPKVGCALFWEKSLL